MNRKIKPLRLLLLLLIVYQIIMLPISLYYYNLPEYRQAWQDLVKNEIQFNKGN